MLYKKIGFIPSAVRDNLPPGTTLEEYWNKNNKFLNGYDNYSNFILLYRCQYTNKKIKIELSSNWYSYIKISDFKTLPQQERERTIKELDLRFKVQPPYYRIYCENQSLNLKYEQNKKPENRQSDDRLELLEYLDDHGIELLESDIGNCKRFSIDNLLEIDKDQHYIFFDIETDDRHGGIEIGRDRILSYAHVDYTGKKKFIILEKFSDDGERKLLESIVKVLKNYDIMVGYNSTFFDLPYIRKRYYKLFKKYLNLKDIAHVDLMKRFQKLYDYDSNITSWALNFIAQYFLKEKKIELNNQGTYNTWKNNKPLLRKYNIHDCNILYKLEAKLKNIQYIISACSWTGTFPNRFYISELLDNYILRFANKKNIHFKTATLNHISKEEKEEDKVKGGYVIKPDFGMYENIHIFDYKSLYPSMIRTWNISPETFITYEPENSENYIKSVNGYWFKKEVGIVPQVCEKFLIEREEYQTLRDENEDGTDEYNALDAIQKTTKELNNATYGTMAQKGNRYYDKRVAESITLAGQFLTKTTSKLFEDIYKYSVPYGDTDSNFVYMNEKEIDFNNLPGKIENIIKTLQSSYSRILKEKYNIDKTYVVIEHEQIYGKLIIVSKKRYAGRQIYKDGHKVDNFIIKGLECIKKDTVKYGKRLQKELLHKLIYDNISLEECVTYVENEKKKFLKGNIDIEELVIQNKISKKLEDYKVKQCHVEIAKRIIKNGGEFYSGIYIRYIITGSKPSLEGVSLDEYNGGGYIYDVENYWDKRIYNLMEQILNIIYPSIKWKKYFIAYDNRLKRTIDNFTVRYNKAIEKKKNIIINKIYDNKFLDDKQKKQLENDLKGVKKKFRFKVKKSKGQIYIESKIKV